MKQTTYQIGSSTSGSGDSNLLSITDAYTRFCVIIEDSVEETYLRVAFFAQQW